MFIKLTLHFKFTDLNYCVVQATDDNGFGQTSVVSLRIMLTDSNDSPPVCESSLYRASLDEGAISFDPPLIIKVRDADATTDINYRYLNNIHTHEHKHKHIRKENHFNHFRNSTENQKTVYQLQFECVFFI